MSVPTNIGQRLVDLGHVDYVNENGEIVGTTGWRLQDDGYVPAKPDKVIVLTDYAGNPPGMRVSLNQPGLQVHGRGDPLTVPGCKEALRRKMKAIFNDLHKPNALRFTDGDQYVEVRAVQSPFSLGFDDNRRPEMACNFIVTEVRQ